MKINGRFIYWNKLHDFEHLQDEATIELSVEELAKQLSWQEIEDLMELTTSVIIKITPKKADK